MKKGLLQIIVLLACCIFIKKAAAQDIHFSQFYFSPLSVNPANTGTFSGNYRIVNNYKSQWNGFSDAFNTYFLGIDVALIENIGIGFSLFNDKAGTSELSRFSSNLSLSYILQVNDENYLIAGFQPGFGRASINYDNLKWDNQYDGIQYDASLPSREVNLIPAYSYFDLNAGLKWVFVNSDIESSTGIAMFHINKPQKSFDSKDPLDYKFVLHHESEFNLGYKALSGLPQIMLLKQGPHFEINVGGMLRYELSVSNSRYNLQNRNEKGKGKNTGITTLSSNKKGNTIFAGCHYRYRDAVIPVVGFSYKQQIILSVSYDINVSDLDLVSKRQGGFEMALSYIGSF